MSIRISSDDAPVRPGYVEIARGVSVPVEEMRAPAYLNARHIDGPLLLWAGQLHWLTLGERWAFIIGWRTKDQIAAKRWPEYRRWHP